MSLSRGDLCGVEEDDEDEEEAVGKIEAASRWPPAKRGLSLRRRTNRTK